MRFATTAARSRSAPGSRPSVISTTVTFDPSAAYTVPSSRPMYPPPTISSRFGTSGSSSAVVESSTFGLSIDTFGTVGRPRSRCNDDVVDFDTLLRFRGRDAQRLAIDDRSLSLDVIHFAGLREQPQTAGLFLDDGIFPAAKLVDIDRQAYRKTLQTHRRASLRREPSPREAAPSRGYSRGMCRRLPGFGSASMRVTCMPRSAA